MAVRRTLEAQRFWAQLLGMKEANMAVQDLEGYDEARGDRRTTAGRT